MRLIYVMLRQDETEQPKFRNLSPDIHLFGLNAQQFTLCILLFLLYLVFDSFRDWATPNRQNDAENNNNKYQIILSFKMIYSNHEQSSNW